MNKAMVALVLVLFPPLATVAQEPLPPIANPTDEDLAVGRRLFDTQCVRCHGREGTGGEGPNLRQARLGRAPDDVALLAVIREGVPGTSMQGAWPLTEREVTRVGAYVRSLGRIPPQPLPGDRARGRALFEGKGGCRTCHVVNGEGGSHGPDLSEVGSQRGPDHLRRSLLDPGAELPARTVGYEPGSYAAYLLVRAVGKDGRVVEGYRVNEDTFTIQLRDLTGGLHSWRKAELAQLDKRLGRSLMPGYASVFSEPELDDLVAYLASLRSVP
jgi:putative heme-binding domain-containing protein